jgi:hypothetical protein
MPGIHHSLDPLPAARALAPYNALVSLCLIMDAVELVRCWWSLPIKSGNDTASTVTKEPLVTLGNTW